MSFYIYPKHPARLVMQFEMLTKRNNLKFTIRNIRQALYLQNYFLLTFKLIEYKVCSLSCDVIYVNSIMKPIVSSK